MYPNEPNIAEKARTFFIAIVIIIVIIYLIRVAWRFFS